MVKFLVGFRTNTLRLVLYILVVQYLEDETSQIGSAPPSNLSLIAPMKIVPFQSYISNRRRVPSSCESDMVCTWACQTAFARILHLPQLPLSPVPNLVGRREHLQQVCWASMTLNLLRLEAARLSVEWIWASKSTSLGIAKTASNKIERSSRESDNVSLLARSVNLIF